MIYPLTISLLNLAVHVLLSEGYMLHPVHIAISNFTDRIFGLKVAAYIQQPLYNCYVCMSSVWTIIWWFIGGNGFSFTLFVNMLLVCAISFIIEKLVIDERDAD